MTSTDKGVPASVQRERVGEQADPFGHGHSPAAWAAVFVVMAGSLVMSLAVVFGLLWLGIVGGVIAALGGVVGKLLGAMGFGTKGHSVH
jgi:hypothetical protein